MMRAVLLFVLASGVASAQASIQNPAPGQSPPGQEQEAEPKEPGRVEGAVLLAGSDAPVRNAQVTLFGEQRRMALNAATGEHGRFVFEKVTPGEYTFSARHPRFVPVDKSGEYSAFTSRKISVSEGQTVKGVVFKMMPGAVVTGKVYDEYGDPQPRTRVTLLRYRYRDGKRQMMSSGGGDSTDDRGEYRIFNVAPGKYYASAQYEDRTWGREAPQTKADEFSYPPIYYPGVLESDTAMELDLRANEERQGIDFRLVRDRAVRIKGKVMHGGKPARGVYLRMMSKGTMRYGRGNSQQADPKTGEFEFSGIRPGIYVITAMKMGPGQSDRLQGRAEVQVASANVDGVVVNLTSPIKIPGQLIIEADTSTAIDFEERTTYVYLSQTEPTMFGGGRGTVKQDGSFELSDVMAGRYRLRIRPLPDGGYLSGALFGDQDIHGQEFEIVAGAQAPLTIRIRLSAATVSGVAEDEDGRPLPDTKILLAPEASKRDRPELFVINSTDQYGKFTLKNIVPGEYRVWALTKVEFGQHLDPDFLAIIEDNGEKVEADENGSYELKLELTEVPE
jgi:protocatechuate 3,4-dioxygenase beta subunit